MGAALVGLSKIEGPTPVATRTAAMPPARILGSMLTVQSA
jgi:hypothetical protein